MRLQLSPWGEVGGLFRLSSEAQIRLGWPFLWPSFIRGSFLDEKRALVLHLSKNDGRSAVKTKGVWLIGTGLLGLAALAQPVLSDRASAQERKPLMIHRLYTGPDG